jgi:hypothetical protein
VDSRLSEKILHQARRQQQELEDEFGSPSDGKKKQPIKHLGAEDNSEEEDEEFIDDKAGDFYDNIVSNYVYRIIC